MYLLSIAWCGAAEGKCKGPTVQVLPLQWKIIEGNLVQVYHSKKMTKCNHEGNNLIKVYQKRKVGNKTQLLMMCAHKTMKMDAYRDMKGCKIYTSIYLIIFEDIFRELYIYVCFATCK